MGQYCNTKVLESNWFNWLLSAPTSPGLDFFRDAGMLMTKVGSITVETASGAREFPNPRSKQRSHCIALPTPVFFNSYNGRLAKPTTFVAGQPRPQTMAAVMARAQRYNQPNNAEIERLCADGYLLERSLKVSWEDLLIDIGRICRGIASKLNLPSEDAKADLASDALLQVATKINSGRLIYTPGRAPVFNLLTTTIHRIMYSILNRDNKAKQNASNTASLLRSLSATSRKRGKRFVTVRRYGSLVACPAGS